jgi:hypothetical protein
VHLFCWWTSTKINAIEQTQVAPEEKNGNTEVFFIFPVIHSAQVG